MASLANGMPRGGLVDCVVTTHDRPVRLSCTLASLMLQQMETKRRLYLVDNSRNGVTVHPQVRKVLRSMRLSGWAVNHVRDASRTIVGVKRRALDCGVQPYLLLLDNDVLFTRPDTVQTLSRTLDAYEIGAVSPVAYDVDDDRVVLNPYVEAYDRHRSDDNGVTEGSVALGVCLAIRRSDLTPVLRYWCEDLPYMEDQILVHFLKRRRGYAYLRQHTVLHIGYAEAATYTFDDDEVVAYLTQRAAKEPGYEPLLALRRQLKDGADFPKPVERRRA